MTSINHISTKRNLLYLACQTGMTLLSIQFLVEMQTYLEIEARGFDDPELEDYNRTVIQERQQQAADLFYLGYDPADRFGPFDLVAGQTNPWEQIP